MFATVAYCGVEVAYIVWAPATGAEAAMRGSIAQALCLLAGSCVGSYVFGATWDDHHRAIEARDASPYVPMPRGDMKQ